MSSIDKVLLRMLDIQILYLHDYIIVLNFGWTTAPVLIDTTRELHITNLLFSVAGISYRFRRWVWRRLVCLPYNYRYILFTRPTAVACLLLSFRQTKVAIIISYLGMKSWDLHVCDRASTITHVDCVKKSNSWYNKIWLCLNVTIWSSQICFSVIFIHFVMIPNIWEKKLHLFTLFSITRHCFR